MRSHSLCRPTASATDCKSRVAQRLIPFLVCVLATVFCSSVFAQYPVLTPESCAGNSPPDAQCPVPKFYDLCAPKLICVGPFSASDPDGNLDTAYVIAAPSGNFDGTTYCFQANQSKIYYFTYVAVDSCGIADTCITSVGVNLDAPSIDDETKNIKVCQPDTLCFDLPTVSGGVPPITYTVDGAPASGPYCVEFLESAVKTVEITVADSCGRADTATITINGVVNEPPAITLAGQSIDLVCLPGDVVTLPFDVVDEDDTLLASTTFGNLHLDDTTITFAADTAGTYCGTLTIADTCGLADTAEFCVTVTINSPPTAACPQPAEFFLCALDEVCVGPFTCTDPDDNITEHYVMFEGNQVPVTNDQFCFTPDTAGVYDLWSYCVDDCGRMDSCMTQVTVIENASPDLTVDGPGNAFLCADDQAGVCFDITLADPGDPDSLTLVVICSNGDSTVYRSIDGAVIEHCFIPDDTSGQYGCTFVVTDACGETASVDRTVDVTRNSPPVASCPGDTSLFQCLPEEICVGPFTCEDDDDNLNGSGVFLNGQPRGLNGGNLCFTPEAAGDYEIMYICRDSCGAADTCYTIVTIDLNDRPEVICGPPRTVELCELGPVCVTSDDINITDPDDNLASVTINGEPYVPGDMFCFDPILGLNELVIAAEDDCGRAVQCTFQLTVVTDRALCDDECPTVVIEKTNNTLQGQFESVSIVLDTAKPLIDIGAFNLLIQYDNSALTLSNVEPGEFITNCGWEYFNFRYGRNGNCEACPTGEARIVAVAESNDGFNHPNCFDYEPAGSNVLATMNFLVSNNRALECQFAPIRFRWYECGDNTFSNVRGDSLFISAEVYEYDRITEITDITADFPTSQGANTTCDVSDKNAPIRCLTLVNGGVDIVCADSIDARADINLNGIPYEVADAVMYARYYVDGLAAFEPHVDASIAASDVNADGLPLSVADLVFLIRVIVGDAQPYEKHQPVVSHYDHRGGVLSVSDPMGAVFAEFDGDAQPQLLDRRLEMFSRFDGDRTRVIVFSLGAETPIIGEFLRADGDIRAIEMATYSGARVVLETLPSEFSLAQNYPNPFNPTTNISFNLAHPSAWQLTIYNVAGQQVAQYSGDSPAGETVVTWDAGEVASGVYLYRLEADGFAETRKMLLLK